MSRMETVGQAQVSDAATVQRVNLRVCAQEVTLEYKLSRATQVLEDRYICQWRSQRGAPGKQASTCSPCCREVEARDARQLRVGPAPA